MDRFEANHVGILVNIDEHRRNVVPKTPEVWTPPNLFEIRRTVDIIAAIKETPTNPLDKLAAIQYRNSTQ